MAGNGSASGNGHSAESLPAPAPPPGAGAPPASANPRPVNKKTGKPLTDKQIEVLERNKLKPGQTGNKNGRPKGSISAATSIQAILSGPSPKNKKLSNLAEWQEIAKERARKGDWRGAELFFNKWAPDQRIPDVVGGERGVGVEVNLNNYERMIAETEPAPGDRPSFDSEN